jgi:hypothetical protein
MTNFGHRMPCPYTRLDLRSLCKDGNMAELFKEFKSK